MRTDILGFTPHRLPKHSQFYYDVRTAVRIVFWGAIFFAPVWALIVLVG